MAVTRPKKTLPTNGPLFNQRRLKKRLTHEQIHLDTKVGVHTISNIASGEGASPEHIEVVARAVGMTFEELTDLSLPAKAPEESLFCEIRVLFYGEPDENREALKNELVALIAKHLPANAEMTLMHASFGSIVLYFVANEIAAHDCLRRFPFEKFIVKTIQLTEGEAIYYLEASEMLITSIPEFDVQLPLVPTNNCYIQVLRGPNMPQYIQVSFLPMPMHLSIPYPREPLIPWDLSKPVDPTPPPDAPSSAEKVHPKRPPDASSTDKDSTEIPRKAP